MKCLRCESQEHEGTSRDCPAYKREEEILAYMEIHKTDRRDAIIETEKEKGSYAKVTASSTPENKDQAARSHEDSMRLEKKNR